MRKFLYLALLILVILVCTLAAALHTVPQAVFDFSLLVPSPMFALDEPEPSNAYCHFEPQYYQELFCTDKSGTQSVSVIAGRVQHIYIFTYGHLDTGTLLLAWGKPSSVEQAGNSITLYWLDRSAYILTNHGFSPMTTVGYLSYGKQKQKPGNAGWKGFADYAAGN